MSIPTDAEVQAALDVLARAHRTPKPKTAAELAAMTPAQVEESGISADEMFRLPGADVPEAER